MLYHFFIISQAALAFMYATGILWQTGKAREAIKQALKTKIGFISTFFSQLISTGSVAISLWATVIYGKQEVLPSWFSRYLVILYGILLFGFISHILMVRNPAFKNFPITRVQWIIYGLVILCSALVIAKLMMFF